MGFFKKKYSEQEDEKLMVLIVKRDQYAFEELYDRYANKMINYFYKMLWQDREKAQDFTQDLFAKIVQKPELFDETRKFKTWIYSVANNMCKNEYRKAEVRKNTSYEVKGDVLGERAGESEKQMDLNTFNDRLKEVLEELDEAKKNTFKLRFFEELSIKEISEIMECSEGTVKSRVFYTLKILNEELKDFKEILVNK